MEFWDLGFRSLGFRAFRVLVEGSGFGVQGLGFSEVQSFGFRLRVSEFTGFQLSSLRFSGFRV